MVLNHFSQMNSQSLYISSRDRISGSNSSFQLPAVQLSNSVSYRVDVEQCIFPKARTNIFSRNNRPFIGIGNATLVPLAATQVSVANALPPNVNYDGTTLATALTTMLTAHCGFAVTVTYSTTTFKLSITVGAGNSLVFSYTTANSNDITFRFLEVTGWLAYNNVVIGSAGGVTVPTITAGVTTFDNSPVKLTDTDWVDVVSSVSTFSTTTSPRKQQILQRVPTINALGTMVSFDETVLGTVSVFSGASIQNMTIMLLDEWGDNYTLPAGFSFNLVLTLYS
jgi:hypothetical protein